MDINKRNRTELKQYFKKTLIPTESQFASFIDGSINTADDGIIRLPGNPLSIESDGDVTRKNVLALYHSLTDAAPDWTIGLRHIESPGAAANPGLAITDGGGTNRLFIASGSGNVGIGTSAPQAKLHVTGGARIDGDVTLAGKVNTPPLVWIKFPFEGNWKDYSDPNDVHPMAEYSKDAFGVVRARGVIVHTTTPKPGMVFGTFPPGFRPAYLTVFNTMDPNGASRVDVSVDGKLTVKSPTTATWLSLYAITFLAAPSP